MFCISLLRLWFSFSGICLLVVLLDDSLWISRCSFFFVCGSVSIFVSSVF